MLRHNPYGTFEPGSTDGVYDEATAAAVRRAKYWLGYPESRIDERSDREFRALLAGEIDLSTAWVRSRNRRLGRARQLALWDRAFQVAVDEVGKGGGRPDRAGLFDAWTGEPGTVYDAIEGDVGYEGDVSGDGAVARVKRIAAETVAFVHVRG